MRTPPITNPEAAGEHLDACHQALKRNALRFVPLPVVWVDGAGALVADGQGAFTFAPSREEAFVDASRARLRQPRRETA